ncbi:MAG: FAD-dependent oxidoreductase [Oscillospiraceae bacterium]
MKRWKCTVCGEIFEGDTPPVPCKVCGAGINAFIELPIDEGETTYWRCAVCGQIFEGSEPPTPCPVCGAGRSAFTKEIKKSALFHKDTNDEFVLIGGGVASLEAAKAIRERNATAKIKLICGEGIIPFSRPSLSDVVGDGLSFEAVCLEDYSYYNAKNIELITDAMAVDINKTEKYVELANGKKLAYTKLLIATGAAPFVPLPKTENGLPIKTLRSFADAQYLFSNAKNKRVIVVGGGILGVEAALSLYERGCTVSIVELGARLMSVQADEYVSRVLQARLEELGISVYTAVSVEEIELDKVKLSSGVSISADMILASVGVRSETGLARKAGLLVNRGIVISSDMRTDDKNIFAAGDCAELNKKVTGLYAAAAEGGRVAGCVMAGEDMQYTIAPPATSFEGASLSLFSTGVLEAEHTSTLVYTSKDDKIYKKLVFKNNNLIGAILLGDTDGAANIIGAVNNNMPFNEAKEQL